MAAAGTNALTTFYPAIRERVAALAAGCQWPDFEAEVATELVRPRLPSPVLVPLAAAARVGGDPARAVGIAAAFGFLLLALRWFDDTQDGDRDDSLWTRVGPARATNLAAGALTVAWRALAEDPALPRSVLVAFGEETVALARGQDDDLAGREPVSFERYWRRMVEKSGSGLALAARLGALAGRDEPASAAPLGGFGRHLGTMVQILDDLDGAFRPDGIGDLASGKITLPVLYALAAEHERRDELARLVAAGRLATEAARVREILDATDTRAFLVWSAFEERDRALAALGELGPPSGERQAVGQSALSAIVAALLADWEQLLVATPGGTTAPVPPAAPRRGYFEPTRPGAP